MIRVILKGSEITTSSQLHDTLAEVLKLPEWYGRNLDALHDCLTILNDVELVLKEWPADGYLARALRVMEDSAEQNPNLKITRE